MFPVRYELYSCKAFRRFWRHSLFKGDINDVDEIKEEKPAEICSKHGKR
jgi:hypothetical protein